jgi:hypothetical protein
MCQRAVAAGVLACESCEIAAETAASTEELGRRRALGLLDHVVDRGRKIVDAGAWHDDGIATTMCFLGDAKKFTAIVFAELYVEVLAFYLQLPCLNKIIHVCKKPRSLGRSPGKREADFLADPMSCEYLVSGRFSRGLAPPAALLGRLVRNREIDLLFECVYAGDEDLNLVPDFVAAICPAADKTTLRRIEPVKIVG